MPPPPPDPSALARKYRALAALRARRDGGAAVDDRASRETLRDLAREFPGCLRELDTLGAAELLRRATAAEAFAAGQAIGVPERGHEPERWIAWIGAYHALMRAALHVKRRLADAPAASPTAARAAELAGEASRIAGFALDEAFVRAVAAPSQGRLGVVVLRALAALYGQPAATIAAALFPVRRPPPYRL